MSAPLQRSAIFPHRPPIRMDFCEKINCKGTNYLRKDKGNGCFFYRYSSVLRCFSVLSTFILRSRTENLRTTDGETSENERRNDGERTEKRRRMSGEVSDKSTENTHKGKYIYSQPPPGLRS